MALPTIDSGYPVFAQATNTSATSVTANAPATAGQGRLLVAIVEQLGVNWFSADTVTGLGLTWTRILHAIRSTNDVHWMDLWAAWAPDTLAAGTVTASLQSGQSNAKNLILGVYALSGTRDGSADVTLCFGATQIADNTGSSQITITGLTPHSFVFDYLSWNFNNTLTPNAATNWDFTLQETNLQQFFAIGEGNTEFQGSATLGGTATANKFSLLQCAVEVLAWDHPVPEAIAVANPKPRPPIPRTQDFQAPFVPLPVLAKFYDPGRPDFFAAWRRGRADADITEFYAPSPPVPTLWGVSLPERFLRPQWNPPKDFFATPVGFFASGPPLDVGWPVTATLQGGNDSAIAIQTPPTQGGDRLVYLAVAWYSGSTAPGPVSVTGFGLTWYRVLGTDTQAPFIEQEGVDIWAAWAPMALPGGVITVGFQNPGATYAIATAYARSKTAGLGDPRLAFGSTFTAEDISGAAAARNTTLATSIGSAAVFAIVDGGDGPATNVPDAGLDGVLSSPVTIATGSLLGNAASSNVNIGLTGNGTFYAFVAAEILGAGGTNMLPWGFFGPQAFTRYPWNPERSAVAQPAMMIPNPGAPTMGFFFGPDAFLRQPWSPERSRVDLPPPALAVVVPADPVTPMLPESFLRPAWNPPRGAYFEPDRVTYFTPFGILSAPLTVEVQERFTVTLVVSNPLAVPVFVRSVAPWARFPVQFGQPAPLGQASIPTALDSAYRNVGLLQVTPQTPQTFTWEAVCFTPGNCHIQAVIGLSDGSTFEAQEVIVTATPIG